MSNFGVEIWRASVPMLVRTKRPESMRSGAHGRRPRKNARLRDPEQARVFWRLPCLRGWDLGQTRTVFSRTDGAFGVRAGASARVAEAVLGSIAPKIGRKPERCSDAVEPPSLWLVKESRRALLTTTRSPFW